MATLKIWTNFEKRKNSTKQPTGGTDINVTLKENTSIENPIFICTNLGQANYCQFGGNYYFINDIIFVTNKIVELHCSMDVLATNKTAISNYTCFVERAQSIYDPWIKDEYLSQKQTGTFTSGTEQSLSNEIDTNTGTYVLRTLGQSGVTGHVLSKVSLNDLMNYANDFNNFNDVFQGLDSIVDGAVKGVFNPDKFIVSCKWFPFKTTVMDLSGASPIKLGNWTSNVNSPVINSPKVVINKTISLPTPVYPNDFRRYDSAWSKIYIYLPCIGSVELDPAKFSNGVGVKYISDLYSGSLTVLLSDADANVPICQFTGNIGIDMPIGKSYQNGAGIASGVIGLGGAIGGAVTGNLLMTGAGISAFANGVKAGVQPLQTMLGGTGTIATIQEMPSIKIGIFAYNSCDFPFTLGRPLMKVYTLGTLRGFIKCSGASLDSIAHGNEKDEINNYLNNGFYME